MCASIPVHLLPSDEKWGKIEGDNEESPVNLGPLSRLTPQAVPQEDVVITHEDVDRAHDRIARLRGARSAEFLLQISSAVAARRTRNSRDAGRE